MLLTNISSIIADISLYNIIVVFFNKENDHAPRTVPLLLYYKTKVSVFSEHSIYVPVAKGQCGVLIARL